MAAIYFHPEGYRTDGPRLMGRHAAGESFLRAFLARPRGGTLWAQVARPEHGAAFAALARDAGRGEEVRVIGPDRLAALATPGAVHHPGPGVAEFAWQRGAFGHGAWSLTGVTHTTASAGAMGAITDLLTAPAQPWDAMICTSRAVRANVEALLEAQREMLRARLGATRFVLPQLPVIPLGIHSADFATDAAARAAARAALGADDDCVVVLFVGRLSFHAKAHPLAMYQALEIAARALAPPRRLLLVECGWHAAPWIARAFAEAGAFACPGVPIVTRDGRDPAARRAAWAAADIFCSLSDNVQETFGLAPVEAMAAGLPVVASDWDGYRDTLRDGIDGHLVPTLMPPPGLGADLALRHALAIDDYDAYCGHACSLVAVDIRAAAAALLRLAADPDAARAMGAAARQRAREVFDWAAILPRYHALWDELAERRRVDAAAAAPRVAHPWPARMDPLAAFAAYPSDTLHPDHLLALDAPSAEAAAERLAASRALAMVRYDRLVPPTPAECAAIITTLGTGPRRAADLVAGLPADRAPRVFRGLVWLVKLGILRRLR